MTSVLMKAELKRVRIQRPGGWPTRLWGVATGWGAAARANRADLTECRGSLTESLPPRRHARVRSESVLAASVVVLWSLVVVVAGPRFQPPSPAASVVSGSSCPEADSVRAALLRPGMFKQADQGAMVANTNPSTDRMTARRRRWPPVLRSIRRPGRSRLAAVLQGSAVTERRSAPRPIHPCDGRSRFVEAPS